MHHISLIMGLTLWTERQAGVEVQTYVKLSGIIEIAVPVHYPV